MKRIAKATLTLLSVACMLLVFGIAGGSDAGTVSAGQALRGGTLGTVGTIVFGTLAGREAERW